MVVAGVKVVLELRGAETPEPDGSLYAVDVDDVGTVMITCTSEFVARLAGRSQFGSVEGAQRELEDAWAEAFEAAGEPVFEDKLAEEFDD